MIRWNGRTDEPHCVNCTFYCSECRWRARQTSVLDMDDPATVDKLFAPGPLALADEMDLGDERHDAMRDDPDLYLERED